MGDGAPSPFFLLPSYFLLSPEMGGTWSGNCERYGLRFHVAVDLKSLFSERAERAWTSIG